MCTAEATALLLQAEETFSACLARIDALILKPLLQAEPSDQKGKENFKLFLLLNDRFQALWNLTEENYRILKQKCSTSESFCIQDIYTVWKGDLFLSLYIHEAWKHHKTVLKQFLTDFTSETSMSLALYTVLHKPIRDHIEQYILLLTKLNEVLKEDMLCVPERRLLEDSKNLPISASTNRSDRILLFDDVLVLIQGNSFQSFDLKLAVWQWKLNQAVRQALNGKRDFPLWGKTGEGTEPPSCRFFTYVFRLEGKFKSASYEGEWHWGKPHGKGTLKWRDGRNHVGDFKEGLEHGFGICLVPRRSEDRYDCYKCHWYEGKMRGYGICEYGNDMVYKGYFKDNVRQGFGILENLSAEHPFKYTGQWENDKKNGYGVWEDKDRGERYIGTWLDDHKHGQGIVVTQSGVCYQRTFHADKMVGSGLLLLEDDSVYEGNFTEDLTFVGKGRLSFANGFILEGTFTNKSGQGLQTHGILNTSNEQLDDRITKAGTEDVSWKIEDILEELVQHQGLESLQNYLEKALKSSLHPLGKLLKALTIAFQATYSGIGANRHLLTMAQEEVKYYAKKIWEFYHDQKACSVVLPLILPCFYPELFMLYMLYHEREDDLYCQGIVDLSLFPDIKLLEFLDVQKHLWPLKDLTLTTNQRRSLIKDKCFLSATECLQKLIDIPTQKSDLDDHSCQCAQQIGPGCECLVMTESIALDTRSYMRVIHPVWHPKMLNTTVDPREKLVILQKTYEEIESTVSRVVEKDYKLPMDDLLPLLMYVVSRAK
ncbi:als2 c-terminal-like protein isoform x3 [Limosa lapponica baueri]|uniref:Als2 c-terminal-like protein isoform x3 n=1 Tax=Limosa lapponica baueri TaxID=1758121 RepID=A0A2I0THB7_LIMLA|nr:als2 c-terminal-like protein isoform x3 [Limosa lapponica baueri]